VLDAAKQGLIVEYPAARSANYKDLLPEFQDKWGPCISMQIIGIGYNPKKIKTPPTSWDALWDPQYKGRVGLTALNSQLGIAFLAEINRLRGGNEENFEPAFKALRELLPNVGAIGANLGAYATLWQQEQISSAATAVPAMASSRFPVASRPIFGIRASSRTMSGIRSSSTGCCRTPAWHRSAKFSISRRRRPSVPM